MFKKGEINNPNGRPKGSLNKATILKNLLIQIVTDRQSELKTMKLKDLIKPVASLLPRESKIDLGDSSLNINISKVESGDKNKPDKADDNNTQSDS